MKMSVITADIEQGSSEERVYLRPLLRNPNDSPGSEQHHLQFNKMNPFVTQNQRTDLDDSTIELANDAVTPEDLDMKLIDALEKNDGEKVESLLKAGADPNATCPRSGRSACHFAIDLYGNSSLKLLLDSGADQHRADDLGRTPLHLAAWKGNVIHLAHLLGCLPEEDHQFNVDTILASEAKNQQKLRNDPGLHVPTMDRAIIDQSCRLGEGKPVPKTWRDASLNFHDFLIDDEFQPGWTALHVACSFLRKKCVGLLLCAGADPNTLDNKGRTCLDVVGSAFYFVESINHNNFADVTRLLMKFGGKYNKEDIKWVMETKTPTCTIFEEENISVVNAKLNAGSSISFLNPPSQLPLQICVQPPAKGKTISTDPLTELHIQQFELTRNEKRKWFAFGIKLLHMKLERPAKPSEAVDGEMPIHAAAAIGNAGILIKILSDFKQKDFIDCKNENGETPLFNTIINGHLDCLKILLFNGASLKNTLPGDINVFHVAAEYGRFEILKELLCFDETITRTMINALTARSFFYQTGYGPIHLAVSNNHVECVKLLLLNNADIRLKTMREHHNSATPLHIAAIKNNLEIATLILETDKDTITDVNSIGWLPLHTAIHHRSRDVIKLLIKEGADISEYTKSSDLEDRETAIQMIMNSLSKPTEFMEEIFDSCIQCPNIRDKDCEITLNYSVLLLKSSPTMNVIQALLKTGNRHGQKRLLLHPLVESFIYTKWNDFIPYFYAIIVLYGLFMTFLTIFVISVFIYKDIHREEAFDLYQTFLCYMVYAWIFWFVTQEVHYWKRKSSQIMTQTQDLNDKSRATERIRLVSHIVFQLEFWVKFGSVGFAVIVPPAVWIASNSDWPRHVASVALLLSWLEMMILLSRLPNRGYYMLMYGKVAFRILKILLTFAFLLVGFTLIFMIQFRFQPPFNSFWAALVKTLVMMTSEFDYGSLFDKEHSKEFATSLGIMRLIFVAFVVFTAIVLMNFMIGVAVNDVNDLETKSNIMRLTKQVEIIDNFDFDIPLISKFMYYVYLWVSMHVHNVFINRLNSRFPGLRLKLPKTDLSTLGHCNLRRYRIIFPWKPKSVHTSFLPAHLINSICNKAIINNEQDDELGSQNIESKIERNRVAISKVDEKLQEIQKQNDKMFLVITSIHELMSRVEETIGSFKIKTKQHCSNNNK